MDFLARVQTISMLFIDYLVAGLVIGVFIGSICILYMYIVDRFQTAHTIRRNYPVIGRFRYVFEHLGEFFRQYFFAMDREELPFNRADRSWIYRAAKNVDRTVAFGSTRSLSPAGEIIFLNSPFPIGDTKERFRSVKTIGEGFVANPYKATSIFNVSGMSYGALSKPAIKAIANGAKDAGVWMNTGEGGLSKYHLRSGCDIIFQLGTAKYGVRNESGLLDDVKLASIAKRDSVKMFEIKLSQGAKPGKGGVLPGEKVTAEIASIRGITEGEASISPNSHAEIQSVAQLLDFIQRVRDIVQKPVGIKFVLGSYEWLDELCEEILVRGEHSAPDFMTIDSADGGTGAAPQTLMDYVGLPLNRSLPIVVDKLTEYGLRSRVHVICSGKMVTPAAVAWALCMGADFVVSARGFMFAVGCIQALQCNKNTCPTGIATHDKKLQRGLDWEGKSHRVTEYIKNLEKELEIVAHSCGVKDPRLLSRKHAHIVTEPRNSVSLEELYPTPVVKEEPIKMMSSQ
ncbi:MAG: FMN-binding glutamate synthase family protein [Sinobacterium sp.]|nr:FMN-binding glutamate synthase family protein [Sinobacterium sp.]